MQQLKPQPCPKCDRPADRTPVPLTNDVGVEDRVVTITECRHCGYYEQDEQEIENNVLSELQTALRRRADGLRREAESDEHPLQVWHDDGDRLIVQDPAGRLQRDLARTFGDGLDRVLSELARRHVTADTDWVHPPVVVAYPDEAGATGVGAACEVCGCGLTHASESDAGAHRVVCCVCLTDQPAPPRVTNDNDDSMGGGCA